MNTENEKMLEIIKESLLKEKYSYYCVCSNISDTVQKNLLKNYDETFPLNRLLAFFGKSKKGKEGIAFTNDGIYNAMGKKVFYIHYADMEEIIVNDSSNLTIRSSNDQEWPLSVKIQADTFRDMLFQLKKIDDEYGHAAMKKSGYVKGMRLPVDKAVKVNVLIHTVTILCGLVGAGFAQIPFPDRYILMAIQIVMIIVLGKIMKSKLSTSAVIAVICTGATSYFGKAICKMVLGWIPGAGNVVNACTAMLITELIAWIVYWFDYKYLVNARIEALRKIEEVSEEFEEKLYKQAQDFKEQVKNVKREKKEYAELLDEYEAYIKMLEHNGESGNRIEEVKQQYSELKELK